MSREELEMRHILPTEHNDREQYEEDQDDEEVADADNFYDFEGAIDGDEVRVDVDVSPRHLLF
jgi:hypothetical protein